MRGGWGFGKGGRVGVVAGWLWRCAFHCPRARGWAGVASVTNVARRRRRCRRHGGSVVRPPQRTGRAVPGRLIIDHYIMYYLDVITF